jgi:hypothetical protein
MAPHHSKRAWIYPVILSNLNKMHKFWALNVVFSLCRIAWRHLNDSLVRRHVPCVERSSTKHEWFMRVLRSIETDVQLCKLLFSYFSTLKAGRCWESLSNSLQKLWWGHQHRWSSHSLMKSCSAQMKIYLFLKPKFP